MCTGKEGLSLVHKTDRGRWRLVGLTGHPVEHTFGGYIPGTHCFGTGRTRMTPQPSLFAFLSLDWVEAGAGQPDQNGGQAAAHRDLQSTRHDILRIPLLNPRRPRGWRPSLRPSSSDHHFIILTYQLVQMIMRGEKPELKGCKLHYQNLIVPNLITFY